MKASTKISFLALVLMMSSHIVAQQIIEEPTIEKGSTTFYVVSDLGRNGFYEQKPIAERMGTMAEAVNLDFVAAIGDVHHFEGVASTTDPLWLTNYELIYTHPDLMIHWFAVCGNHEYRGKTQAVLDYTKVSRRWTMPSKYYAREIVLNDSTTALLLFIDTTPLIEKYRTDVAQYPDAAKENRKRQLSWIEQQLKKSKAKWKIVLGHHPVYAATPKEDTERTDMQRFLCPLLDKYKVDAYFCGHIHNFQHITPAGSTVEYIVNSSGSLSRPVQPTADTKYCSSEAGFSVVSLSTHLFSFRFMNSKGKQLYHYTKRK
ncbi:MAG: metallophosphoesterase [Bacteroidaceae bacterium]